MGLKLQGLVLAITLGGVSAVQAQEANYVSVPVEETPEYYQVKGMKVKSVSVDVLNQTVVKTLSEREFMPQGLPNVEGKMDPIDKASKVIAVGRDLVALGEDIYRLVIKGKPTNTTTYAPISVVPKENGQPVDMMDTENWSEPKMRTYEVSYQNWFNMDVVSFKYSVIYSYNGSYNETGKYLTSVQIIPDSARTLFGWDFTATMKLGGIQNQGTKANPEAGAVLLMEYTVGSFLNVQNDVDKFFVTGTGKFKKY